MLNVNFKLVKSGLLKKMGPSAWAVLTAIVIHMDGDNKAYPGKARLRELTGLGRDSVTNAIKTLKDLEILMAEQQVINGKKSTNIYKVKCDYLSIYVNVSKFELAEEITPHTENQYTGNQSHTEIQYTVPHTDLPCTGNQVTLSITNTSEVLPISSLTKEKKEKKKFENFENKNFEEQSVNDLIEVSAKKEKSCAKKEKKPATDATPLPKQENALVIAASRCAAFFEEWPAMKTKLIAEARITDPDFDFERELNRWLRLNAHKSEIISNPESYMHSLFPYFLMNYNNSNHGRQRSETNQKAKPGATSNDGFKFDIGVLWDPK